MNPYEYESTLDCRDDNRGGGGGGIGGVGCGGTLPLTRPHHPQQQQQQQQQQQHNTLQHQNQQNLQLQQQTQQQQQQQQSSSSSHYDYEYQHLPHRPPDMNNTAQRTHGRQGFLLEGVTPTAPPDVPPRNPTMSRMNNGGGRLIAGVGSNNPNDLGVDFEPSCLVRTPSGNVYIPSGNININKGSPIDYKSGSACSTPTKDTLKGYERSTNGCMGPVLPPRSVMSGLPTHHYSAPMNFRKDLAARCSAKCVAIGSMTVFATLCVLLIILTGFGVLHWSPTAPCTVLVGNEAAEVTAAKSTNTDLSKLHDPTLRSKTGQGSGLTSVVTSSTASSSLASAVAGLQSTSASSVAASATSASSSLSSSSSLTPALSSSSAASSSLANANNGGRSKRDTGSTKSSNTNIVTIDMSRKHLTKPQDFVDYEDDSNDDEERVNTRNIKESKRYRRSLMASVVDVSKDDDDDHHHDTDNKEKDTKLVVVDYKVDDDNDEYDYGEEDSDVAVDADGNKYEATTSSSSRNVTKTFIDLITNESKVNDEKYFTLTKVTKEFMVMTTTTQKTTSRDVSSNSNLKAKSNYTKAKDINSSSNNNSNNNHIDDDDVFVFVHADKTLKINKILNLNQSNQQQQQEGEGELHHHHHHRKGNVFEDEKKTDKNDKNNDSDRNGDTGDDMETSDNAKKHSALKQLFIKDYLKVNTTNNNNNNRSIEENRNNKESLTISYNASSGNSISDKDELKSKVVLRKKVQSRLMNKQFDKPLNNNLRGRIKIENRQKKSGKMFQKNQRKKFTIINADENDDDDDKVDSIKAASNDNTDDNTDIDDDDGDNNSNEEVEDQSDTGGDGGEFQVNSVYDSSTAKAFSSTSAVVVIDDNNQSDRSMPPLPSSQQKHVTEAQEDFVEIDTESKPGKPDDGDNNNNSMLQNHFEIKQKIPNSDNDSSIDRKMENTDDNNNNSDDVDNNLVKEVTTTTTNTTSNFTSNNEHDLVDNYEDINPRPKGYPIATVTATATTRIQFNVNSDEKSDNIKVDKFKLNDRNKLSAAENEKIAQAITNVEELLEGRRRTTVMEMMEKKTATPLAIPDVANVERQMMEINDPKATATPRIITEKPIPGSFSDDGNDAFTPATDTDDEHNSAELMLNDDDGGLLKEDEKVVVVGKEDAFDDIDIIKLDNGQISKQQQQQHQQSSSSSGVEHEIYKTVQSVFPSVHYKPPPLLPLLPATMENEILKPSEEGIDKLPASLMPLKPYVSESYDRPSKRILVNLTIATDDGSGSIYTLHVAVPTSSADGGASNGTHNLEQVLTHEKRENQQQQQHQHQLPKDEFVEDKSNNEFINGSPYCVPEPPPRMPDCPCLCNCAKGGGENLFSSPAFLGQLENVAAHDGDDFETVTTDRNMPERHIETATILGRLKSEDDADADATDVDDDDVVHENDIDDNFVVAAHRNDIEIDDNDNDDNKLLQANESFTPTSLTPPTSFTTSSSSSITLTSNITNNNNNTNNSSVSDIERNITSNDGVNFACPDVMPILILEGARTFPARSFPPDGTTFGQITLGQKLTKEIQPYSYWNMQFYQSEPAYVKFDYTIPRGASIGVYGRRNALPTHTQYHFKEVLSGFSASTRTTRAAHLSITREVTRYMESGHWFVSLYNDDGDVQEVTFYAAIAEDMTQNCPNGCSGNGQCLLGHCQCNPGFGGDDCSESVCPVLCSQHGEYINGECICNPGWKGKECSLRHDECEVADCNGHGHCVSGKCQCMRGYKGKFCEEVDCPHPTCSGHGFCADGTCICKKGWKGTDCATMDQDALQCLPDCTGHGSFDLDTQTCTCESKWSGDDCSKELCDLDCGQHGRCEGEACACDPDWGGEFCNTKLCDARCNEHGQCKNGTCLCVTGWNGKHCTIEGCPNSCAGHGQCRVSGEGQWECRCYEGWDGPDCGIALELNCGDSKDNDKDGLVDCEDPECCASHVCKTSQLCVSAPKPIDVLLRKQPPAITASFFERMKFLIDESSLQNYAKLETFNESRSAVIRGRVVTSLGMGLVGVRVSTTTLLEGFTLTRDDGWFDLMVNGGGAVTLQFGRSPFRPQSRIVQVPWNEVVIIDVVVMSMSEEKGLATITTHTCFSHDYDLMKPVVLASWKHGFQGACPDRSAILAESQVIQESLQIPGTGLNLVYHSSRAAGYLSTIKLQLTPETIPATLHLIHLRITIEGILFERVFEADPGIKFTYAWNRLNIYRQRVYGVTTAVVKVGYQYTDCKDIIWDIQTTKLSGHDMSISEVGGWNLDIHHRYNFHEGILQKGDGSNIYLKNKPRVILTTMGDGHQRPLDCNDCDGLAMKQRLLAPVALAASPDGSLYVGDFNYIRRIMTDGTIRTVVKLNATRVSYRYHMALSPLDGTLYISDPESHQIIRVRDTSDYSQPDKNWEPIVGSGERCLPGDEAHCGDGALAKDAKLAYPKGIAISSENLLYFADGTNIRMVDRDGIVSTLIGNHMHKSHWKPIPCEGTLKLEEMHLRWPTELAVSPLDNTLHIIDDHMILRMTPDGRVRVISGRPLHCATAATAYDTDLATHATLVMPQSIAFGPLGELYVAESDSQRINRVRVIGTDGRIAPFAGAESKCNCLERGCDCFEAEHYLATSAKFNTIAALSVTPDGHVHIADQANYRIRSVMSSIPEASTSREYEIYSPDMQEIYIFNRFGQHVSTKNILTGETTYVFTYNVNTSNGKLSTVTDAAGNKVFLLRDYTSQVNSIENTKGQKCRLRMTRMKMLHELSTPDNYNVTFEYHGPTGLLKTKLDSTGRSYVYNYDEFGRLTSAVTPTGRVIDLTFDLSVKGAQVKVSENAQKEISMLIQGSTVIVRNGEAESRTTVDMDGSTTSITPWGHNLQMEVVPYAILAEVSPMIGESYPVPAKQRTEIAGDLANRFEWRYFVRRLPPQGKQNKGPRPVTQVGRKLRVNGDNVLSLEYDRETQSVVVMVDDKQELLNVTYDRTARPVSFRPQSGDYADVDLEYDRFGRLVTWKWGVLQEAYSFDRNGRLNEIKYGDGSSMVYAFKDMFGSLPLKVTTPRRSDYLLQYDDAGALQSLTTPRGHIHSFSLQTSLGFFKYQYFSPINRHPFEILYNDEGQILAKIHPHQSGKVAFVHDAAGRLETILAGLSSTHYTYQDTTSLVKSVEVQEPGFELRREFKYHAGILKDEKLRFGSKNSLASAHYKYAYDGNARLSGIEMAIDDKELPTTRYKYSQNLGQLEVVQDLKITRNAFNRTVIQDSSKQFFTIVDYDQHGRVKSVLMNIKSFDVFRLELDYDLRNRIKSQKTTFGRSTAFDKINYNADGHVVEVLGTNNWKYLYDENGNTVGIIDQGEKFNLGYDIGDRVIQVGEVEFNNYDARGFVVRRGEQKYRYNNRGQLIHAFERERFQSWYYYDDRSRLVAWHDSKGNVTQYFYANPRTPQLVTHVHFPKLSKTMKFFYDDRDMLMALENVDQRYYVATDQNGSPLAFFDLNGGIIKEVKRTPFGRTIKDTNPDFFVPVDFHGGLIDPHTKLVYTEGRLYDPTVGQWMTPLWETLATEMSHPTDVFIYRYHNNDPINPNVPQNYMIDLESWLQVFGYDLQNMQSSKYTKLVQYTPQASIKSNTLAPDFGVISGLECIVEKTNEKFSDFDFVPKPLLKMEPKMRNLLPRISYRRGVFGEGVLLSRISGRAMVSVVDGSNSVVQDVVSSVFNNSFFLDLHFSIHDQDVFYFVKDNILKLRDDNEELRRLGGMFNISTHEITDHGGSAAKELRLHGPDAVVIIKYGVDPEQERHRILKHAHKRAVERAWELEKQLVAAGFQGRGDWSEEEKEELVQHGDVDGWIGIDIHSIHKYPQLADDPGNVAFQRDAKRKRRKTGASHRSSRSHKQQKLIDMTA